MHFFVNICEGLYCGKLGTSQVHDQLVYIQIIVILRRHWYTILSAKKCNFLIVLFPIVNCFDLRSRYFWVFHVIIIFSSLKYCIVKMLIIVLLKSLRIGK